MIVRSTPVLFTRSIHQRQVRGLEFDPFCPNNLATGGGDGMVKVWSIPPEGLKEDLISPLVSINTGERGYSRRSFYLQ